VKTLSKYNLVTVSLNRVIDWDQAKVFDKKAILEWFNCLLPLQYNMSPLVVEQELERERKLER